MNRELLEGIAAQGLDDEYSLWKYNDYLFYAIEEEGAGAYIRELSLLRDSLFQMVTRGVCADGESMLDLYWQAVKALAPHRFEDYLIYMEKNRDPKKKFYIPRRKTLRVVVRDLQALEDGKYVFYGLSLPPRVGKSTLCLFFLSFVCGRRPDSHSALASHSGILAEGFYTELMNLMLTNEYTFSEIFPGVHLQDKSALKHELNFNNPDRFPTLTCRGIDGTWTGEVDISPDGYLYVDDLIRDRTESLSPSRLEKRYQDYLNVLTDRKNDGSRELMVGTRWNVLDPLGRMESRFKNDPRYLFRKIPALNENNESNFHYSIKGFSTEFYLGVKKTLDSNEWMAKYQQNPFIREGILFPEEELRFFNGILPEGGLVGTISACDVAWGGGDSLSMPIGYLYENGDIYIVDWIFDRGPKESTLPLVAGAIIGNGIQAINFEANNGGDMYAAYIDDMLHEKGYSCSITNTRAPNTMAKTTRIVQFSGDIKRHCIFLADNDTIRAAAKSDKEGVHRLTRSRAYDEAFGELTFFVQIGKNEHDDAADSLAQLEKYSMGATQVEVSVGRRFF